MFFRLFVVFIALLIPVSSAVAQSDSDRSIPFTLQVAAFPSAALADSFVVQLVEAGEHPSCATVRLEGRGYWTRVFVGLFPSVDAARQYGEGLVGRRVITEFLVKRADFKDAVTRPRRVTLKDSPDRASSVEREPKYKLSSAADEPRQPGRLSELPASVAGPGSIQPGGSSSERNSAADILPVVRGRSVQVAPDVDTTFVPRPDPVNLAIKLVLGETALSPEAPDEKGGLWITGETDEAFARLRWIVGDDNADLIKLDGDGQVRIDREFLSRAAGLGPTRVEDSLRVAHYISSNEGLLLVVQLSEGRRRYCLNIGPQAQTYGRIVEVPASINLDNNFDSRINPYRKHGRKLDHERPPQGFDSLVALNPIAQWFNLATRSLVPSGEITFHELAEAHAKLDLELDYLEDGLRPGAHAIALERERRLESQRPAAGIIVTAGSNRVLRSKEEIRLFFADTPGAVSQR